jgi:hypothetical protein
MNRILVAISLSLLAGIAFGQTRLEQLPEEVRQIVKNAPKPEEYPNSGYVTLSWYQRHELRDDGKIAIKSRILYKVLKESARSSLADFPVSYSAHYDKVTRLWGRTILPDGKVAAVKPSDIRDTPVYSSQAMYEDTRSKEFTFPQVTVGAVLEAEYETLETPRMPRFFHDEFFLTGLGTPLLQATSEIVVGKGWNIRYRTHNADFKPQIETLEDGRTRYRYEYAWKKELKDEPAMPPSHKLFAWVEIASEYTWQQIDQWWSELAKGREKLPAEIMKVVQDIKKKHTDPVERIRAIYYWVQRNIRYVAIELGQSGYQPHTSAQICKAKYGDCKDMSTLLVGMLREAGIQANWVLIGVDTQEYPPDEYWDGPYSFDHCIARAQAGDQVFWLDATGGMFGLGEIPSSLRGCKGLVIGTGGRFEKLPGFSMDTLLMDVSLKVRIHPNGSARVTMRSTFFDDAAMSLRAAYRNLSAKDLKQMKESMWKGFAPKGKTIHFSYTSPDNWDKPFTINGIFEVEDYVYRVGNLLLITLNPTQMIAGGGNTAFSEPTREYPIYSPEGPAFRLHYELTLPDGYDVLAMPETFANPTPFTDGQVAVSKQDKHIVISGILKYKPAWIPPEEYSKFRETLLKLVKTSREQVFVLRKQIDPSPQE